MTYTMDQTTDNRWYLYWHGGGGYTLPDGEFIGFYKERTTMINDMLEHQEKARKAGL